MTRPSLIWLLCLWLGLALAMSPAVMAGIHAGGGAVAEQAESTGHDGPHAQGHTDAHDHHGQALAPHSVADCGLFCNHCLAGLPVLAWGSAPFVSPAIVAATLSLPPPLSDRLDRPPRV